MKWLLIVVILASMTATGPAASAVQESQSMRCRGGIVSVGDTAVEVVGKCGEPAYKSQGVATRVIQPGPYNERTILSVPADIWIFNFGPNEFQYRVLLDSGSVFRIESLDDYGY